MNELQALLRSLREHEIQVWEEDGKLRFRAPPGRMTPEIGDRLRAAKDELLAYLRQSQTQAADALPAPSQVDRAGPLPLSPMQRRLLFIEEMNPGSGVYHLPVGLQLRGALDVAALGRALSHLIDRHEALRMRFERTEGDHVLKIRPPAMQPDDTFALATASVTATELEAAATAEIARPFDLEAGPLLRATLFRVMPAEREDASPSDAVYALLIVMHHIVSDGWSTEIVLRELGALYRAATHGAQADLPALERQYVDFADWYARLADEGALKAQEDYWRARLQGAATVLELPTDHARPAVQSLDGATYDFDVPEALRSRLLDFCRSRSATPYTVLLAAFNAWLMRRTEQADIAVGMVAANRRAEFQHAVGMFMNTLVLRTQVEAADSFDAVLDRVRDGVLGAQEHQQLSFERLVDIALPTRSLSHSPLFQVMMMYQDGSAQAPDFGAVNAMPWALPNAYSKYDLTLSFMDGPGGMRGGFEYASALFDAASVRRMSDEFLRLLSALIAAPQRAVGEHALLGEDEIARVLGEWNATESDYTATPIHLQVHAQAGLTPSAVALIDGAVEWNYAQLWRRVERVSAHLSAQGAVPGERIGVFMDRSAEMVIAMLAVMRCGAAYVPLDPAYPRERIRYVCEDAGLRRVLVQSFLAHELPDRRLQAIAIDSLLDLANASADAGAASSDSAMPETVPSIGAEHAAYMIYTSGSTGRPKGVSLSHRNAANFFAALDRRDVAGGVAAGEVPCWLAVTSISFDISVLELLWTLARGHKVVLQPATPPAALLPMLAEATKAGGARAQIDFSLFYFASDADAAENEKYRLLLEGARFADREGFEAVWVPERHFHAFGGQFPNPSVAAAAIAAITERVKIRAGSVVLPLHDPLRVAEEWSMVDNLSDGRAGIAFASGWHFGDFVFFPENFEQRHRIMREGIDTVRALWRGESVVRRGGTGKDAELGTRPRPLQPELPVWITAAASPETFRYAGEIGANVLTHLLGQSLDELREKIEIYRAARAEHGHDPAAGRVTLMIHTFVGDDPETVRAHVEQPFKQYLRSSIGLLRPVAESQGLNLEVDMESVVDAGFERYFSTSALFGTPEACLDIATRIHALGVDEMACLIDFGVEIEAAIAGLDALARLKAMTQARSARVRHFARHGGGVPGSSALDSSALDLSALDLIRRHGVTHLQSTPTFAGLLLDQIETSGETPGLQRWLIGGEALPPRLAARIRERLPVRLLNMYGPTETTVWSANDTVDSDTITLGRPLANTRLYVLDPRGLPVPVGVPGELFIAGDGVAQSYWQRPDLTAERFLPDPFSPQPGRRMYRTGDIVRYRDDGRLQFVGRNDGQVKLRGFRIELGEIEAQLRNQPGVREAAVRVIAGAGQEPRLLAYVASDRAQTEPHTESAVGSSAGSAEDSRWPVARFAFPDGTAIFHSDERQLGALYKEVFEDRMYLRHGIVLQDHACVFDVGANVGSFSVFVQRNCRHPVVHSFEPIPPTFAALRRNAEWHGIDGKVHNCGLSDRAEVQPFTYYPQMSGLSGRFANAEEEIRAARSVVIDQLRREGADAAMSDEEIGEWLAESFRSQTFECRLRTLSEVIREEGIAQIDLLKIDVEKSECLVLGGIADEDWPKIQQIAIEVDGAENLQRVRDVLDARGFRYVVEDFVNVEAGEGVERFDVYMLYARREQIARPLPRPQGRPHRSAQATAAQGLCPDRLRMALKTALPEYMVPDAIHVLDALPRTPNGKLDAAALPTEAPRALVTQAVSPRSDQERTIAEIWQRVLGRSVASIHDNFFESGGNSLLVARVRAELQKAFGRNVSVVELFRYPTIASLADFFGQSEDAPRPSAAEASADRGAQRRQRIVRRGRGAADARATESEPEGVA